MFHRFRPILVLAAVAVFLTGCWGIDSRTYIRFESQPPFPTGVWLGLDAPADASPEDYLTSRFLQAKAEPDLASGRMALHIDRIDPTRYRLELGLVAKVRDRASNREYWRVCQNSSIWPAEITYIRQADGVDYFHFSGCLARMDLEEQAVQTGIDRLLNSRPLKTEDLEKMTDVQLSGLVAQLKTLIPPQKPECPEAITNFVLGLDQNRNLKVIESDFLPEDKQKECQGWQGHPVEQCFPSLNDYKKIVKNTVGKLKADHTPDMAFRPAPPKDPGAAAKSDDDLGGPPWLHMYLDLLAARLEEETTIED